MVEKDPAAQRLAHARLALAAAEENVGLASCALIGDGRTGASGGAFHISPDRAELMAAAIEGLPACGWAGFVGLRDIGWEAAHERGLDLSRTLIVQEPGIHAAQICALLLEDLDLVCVESTLITPAQQRRLSVRAHMCRHTLITTVPWPGISHPWRSAQLIRAV